MNLIITFIGKLFCISIIILFILLLAVIITEFLINPIVYEKKVGYFMVNRLNKKISMVISIKNLLKYYKKRSQGYDPKEIFTNECDEFFRNLDKNTIYKTHTHKLMLSRLKAIENVTVIKEKSKKKYLWFEKCLILNIKKKKTKHNVKRKMVKYQFYKVYFIINN